ncbi:hypothetical protein VTH06DRAFT_61 [Thermothelomyces fergusii]
MLGARNSDANPSSDADALLPGTSDTVVWTVAAIVGGVLVLGSALALVTIYYNRRRRARRRKEEPAFLPGREPFKRRKVNEAGLSREEEERRAELIRKSLAERSTRSSRSFDSWAGRSSYSTMAVSEQVDKELEEIEGRESTRLKDDWKRWEAQIREERSISCGQHPAVSAAADRATVFTLAVPTPSRYRSQDRMYSRSPTPPSSLPPLPARHTGEAFRG